MPLVHKHILRFVDFKKGIIKDYMVACLCTHTSFITGFKKKKVPLHGRAAVQNIFKDVKWASWQNTVENMSKRLMKVGCFHKVNLRLQLSGFSKS